MKPRHLLLWVAVCLFAVAGSVSADELLYGDPVSTLGQLTGRGIADHGAARPAYDAHGREIVWRETRRTVDPMGGTHVFYSQYLQHEDREIELYGSRVGVHYAKDGSLTSVGGTQFTSVMLTNAPQIGPEEASERAYAAVQSFARQRLATDTEQARAVRARSGELTIVRRPEGDFRFVWRSMADDSYGDPNEVFVDAQSELVLAKGSLVRGGNCAPDQPTNWSWASVVPLHPNAPVTHRWIEATATSTRPGFTHEAYWPSHDWMFPPLSALQQIGNGDPNEAATEAWRCNPDLGRSYSLIPLAYDGLGYPAYANVGFWQGRAAGDALYQSRETMEFLAWNGIRGIDGYASEVSVILNSTFAGDDQARFLPASWFPTDGRKPSGRAVIAIGPSVNYRSAGSSLDWIAHEWGHGVNDIRAGGPFPTTGVGPQMEEGWADVFGTMVEKKRQPAGNGVEQSNDWTMHEDAASGGYARGAIDDDNDGDGFAGHGWHHAANFWVWRTLNDRVHKNDNSFDAGAHPTGNMLVMAMKLMADGFQNPICYRSGNHPTLNIPWSQLTGCGTHINGIGVDKAVIIMWYTMFHYIPGSVTWETVGNYAMDAARDVYGDCASETAVKRAFTGIGYPPTRTTTHCSPNF